MEGDGVGAVDEVVPIGTALLPPKKTRNLLKHIVLETVYYLMPENQLVGQSFSEATNQPVNKHLL